MTNSLVQFLSRPSTRIGLGVAVVGAVALGLGLAAFGAGDRAAPRRLGPALSVAVVAPVEPEIEPGGVMDVGALNDGFDRAALERVSEPAYGPDLPLDAYAGEDWGPVAEVPRMPPPTPVERVGTPMQAYRAVVDRVAEGVDQARSGLDDGSRHFGFDRPRRDYAAERAKREAARDAREASDTAVPYTHVDQYSQFE